MLPTDHLPADLAQSLQAQAQRLWERRSDEERVALQQWMDAYPEEAIQLSTLFVASEYALTAAIEQWADFSEVLFSRCYQNTLSEREWQHMASAQCGEGMDSSKALDRALRRFRRRMMLRILWRDSNRLADFRETSRDMSLLAECCISQAVKFHYDDLQPRFGCPIGKRSGDAQPFVVLGMGKLGGYELNVSSDIDLIFAYPESGETGGARKSISNQEFFIKLGQRVIASLDTHTVDGYVFRVDMRLRPYGDSGALVLNFDALEEYYQTQGRDWERFAMIKARVVSGDFLPGASVANQQLMALLQPFTYRKYVDFSAIESMRSMKDMIRREVKRRGIEGDVKLGAGGIREVEFVVQVFQMMRGGRDPRLQERSVLTLLPLLEQESLLPPGEAKRLGEAYVFLRNTEHALQGFQDRQTQSLPDDELGQRRLAWQMGFSDWSGFLECLSHIRERVHHCFNSVIALPTSEQQETAETQHWQELWPTLQSSENDLPAEDLAEQLLAEGFVDAEAMAQRLVALRSNRSLRAMQPVGIERLDRLMPRLLQEICEQKESAETLSRVCGLIETVARRTAYLLLLVENPGALKELVRLCAASQWIADLLTGMPSLLDELLNTGRLYSPPDKQALSDELRQLMMRVSWDDTEAQMETLRYFRNAHALIVAASEVAEVLPIMKVSDYLTWIAEVILQHVVQLAWQQMKQRHGEPSRADDQPEPEFIVVGYGKLGGIELGHGSDLDLVFIFDAPAGYSDGEKPLDHQTWFTRLGQKIIHILTTQTLSGPLYEVDMRLRPSGNSGMLVSSLAAFERYQLDDAWTWEHQALVRARPVAGGTRLASAFETVRKRVLMLSRDEAALREEVVSMRQKMREHLGASEKDQQQGLFHLKQDAGGIVDIEFLVQYAVLAWSHGCEALTTWTDNVRLLEVLSQHQRLPAETTDQLIDAYKRFRALGHRLSLQNQGSLVSAAELATERQAVSTAWRSVLQP